MIDKYAASFLINSALYVIGVFVAGIVWHDHAACLLAIGTAVAALASTDCAVGGLMAPAIVLALVSWLVGLAAFGALIVA